MLEGLNKGPNMIDEVQELLLGGVTVEDDPRIVSLEDFAETIIVFTSDSGCCDHVLDLSDTSGYACVLGVSPGSKQGRNFIVGNGERPPNRGQIFVNMEAENAFAIDSTFSGGRPIAPTHERLQDLRPRPGLHP